LRRAPLLAVILGPTASGKTSLSLELAAKFRGEIVNCDSVAMYREFHIGTAKPAPEERSRVPHHLIDVIDPTGYTTAGEYARMARAVIQEISGRGGLPIVVGGTGLYLRALLEGLFPGPERSEEMRVRLRSRAEQRGAKYLHRILSRLDSKLAGKIHPNDAPKLIRAIEVSLAARQPMSEQWTRGREALKGFRILRIGLDPDRQELYARINRRVKTMFNEGLVEETRQLLARYGAAARPLGSLGYKQVVQMLTGDMDLESTIAAVQQAHRNYAKRQMTWFRREPNVHWSSDFGDRLEIVQQALAVVERQT